MAVPKKALEILEFIGSHEAPKGYNQVYGKISKADQPPKPLVEMTVNEVLVWQDSIDSKYNSEAAGRFQFMEDTLRALVKQGRIDGEGLFDEAGQQAAGFELMKDSGWDKYVSGKMDAISFGNNLAGKWAALPRLSGDGAGLSTYEGDSAGNHALTDTDSFLSVLDATPAQLAQIRQDASSAPPSAPIPPIKPDPNQIAVSDLPAPSEAPPEPDAPAVPGSLASAPDGAEDFPPSGEPQRGILGGLADAGGQVVSLLVPSEAQGGEIEVGETPVGGQAGPGSLAPSGPLPPASQAEVRRRGSIERVFDLAAPDDAPAIALEPEDDSTFEVSKLDVIGEQRDNSTPVSDAFRSPRARGVRLAAAGSFLGDVGRTFTDSGFVRALERLVNEKSHPPVDGYDPLTKENLRGFERYADALQFSESPDETTDLIAYIMGEEARRAKMAAGGRIFAPILGTLIQPEGVASMVLIPGAMGLTFMRSGARVGGATVVLEAASERIRQGYDPLATTEEGVIRVASAGILGGGIGGIFGSLGGRKAGKIVQQLSREVEALHGLAARSERIAGPSGKKYDVEYGGTGGRAGAYVDENGKVVVNEKAAMEEFEAGDFRNHGYDDETMPDVNKWIQFRTRLAVAEHETGLPFGDGSGYKVRSPIPVGKQTVRVEVGSRKNQSWASYQPPSGADDGILRLDFDQVLDAFERKLWTITGKQKDGSQATPLARETFKEPLDWFNFVVNHELLHEKMPRSLFPDRFKTDGEYEDFINQKALVSKWRYVEADEAAPSGAADPKSPSQAAKDSYDDWDVSNQRALKGFLAKAMDKLVPSAYKRVHTKAYKDGLRHLMDELAMDSGLQTLANRAGLTKGASIDTMKKVHLGQADVLKQAEDAIYVKYLGYDKDTRIGDVPLIKTAGKYASKRSGKTMNIDEFRVEASLTRITGKAHEIAEVNELAAANDVFYKYYADEGLRVGALGGLTPERIQQRLVEFKGKLKELEDEAEAILGRENPEGLDAFNERLKTWKMQTSRWLRLKESQGPSFKAALEEIQELMARGDSDLSPAIIDDTFIRTLADEVNARFDWDEYEMILRTRKEADDLPDEPAGIVQNIVDHLKNPPERPKMPLDRTNIEHRMLEDLIKDARGWVGNLGMASSRRRGTTPLIEESYFTRLFKPEVVKAHRSLFKNLIAKHYRASENMSVADADNAAEILIEGIEQSGGGVPTPGGSSFSMPSMTRLRELGISNKDLVNVTAADGSTVHFIELDGMSLATNYAQRMGTHIEFSRKFNGDNGLDAPHFSFNERLYGEMKREKSAHKGESSFADHWAPLERDMLMMKDRVANVVVSEPWRWDNRATSVLKDWAILTYMGKAALSALPDNGKLVMAHGLTNVFGHLRQDFDASLKPLMMGLESELRRAGSIADVSLGSLARKFTEVGTDPMYLSKTEKFIRGAAGKYFVANLLGPFTYGMRKMDGGLRINKIMDDAVAVARGTADEEQIAFLAQYGIDRRMAGKITKQVDDGIATLDEPSNLWGPNSDNWTDPDAVMAFRGAIMQGTDNTILVASAADKPDIIDGVLHFRAGQRPWLDTYAEKYEWTRQGEYWRVQSGIMSLPFQFWNYSMAATNKIAVAGLENPNTRFVGAMGAMSALGYMALYLRTPDTVMENMSTVDTMVRVIDQSGMMGVATELAYMAQNTVGGLTGANMMPFNWKYGSEAPSAADSLIDLAGPAASIGRSILKGSYEAATDNPSAASTLSWGLPGRNYLLFDGMWRNGIDSISGRV